MPNEYTRQWFDVFLETMPVELTQFEVDAIAARLPRPSFERLLDICCGPGRHAALLAERGYDVTGVDRDAVAVARAAEHVPQGRFVELDMRELHQLDGPFDAAIILWQSFGFFDPDANDHVLADIAALLRPGGKLVLDLFTAPTSSRTRGGSRRRAIRGAGRSPTP